MHAVKKTVAPKKTDKQALLAKLKATIKKEPIFEKAVVEKVIIDKTVDEKATSELAVLKAPTPLKSLALDHLPLKT